MSIVTTPREIQLMIFGQLKVSDLLRVSETCHRLKDVARDPALWRQLTLTYEKVKNNNEACRNHVSRCSSLREIFIIGEEKTIRSDKIMNVVMKANKDNLTSIILSSSFAGLSNSSFEKIADMTKLTHLAVGGSKLKKDGIENLAVLTELRSLKVPGIDCGPMTPMAALANVFSILKKLEEVEIIMDRTFPSDEVVESLVNNNPNLHHLDISTSSIPSYHHHQNSKLSSSSLTLIANSCPQLTYIGIGNLAMFRSNDILELVTKCPKLKHANFERTHIDDAALDMMSTNCLELEYLSISGCYKITPHSLDRLEQSLPNLEIADDEEEYNMGPQLYFCSLM